jgi:hypothetical protein
MQYGPVGTQAAHFQRSRSTPLSVAAATDLIKRAIEAADLWILHEIDPQMVVRRDGYAMGDVRQILFYPPRLMARLIAADPASLLEAPGKFAIMAMPGGETMVRWFDPAPSYARYNHPDLTALGQELSGVCERIVESALTAR